MLLSPTIEPSGNPTELKVDSSFSEPPFWMRNLAVAPYNETSDPKTWTVIPNTPATQCLFDPEVQLRDPPSASDDDAQGEPAGPQTRGFEWLQVSS